MRCVAAPIVNPDGWLLGALSISGPTSRMTPEMVESLAARLKDSCSAIAGALMSADGNGRRITRIGDR